ncbi:Uncharacterised protein [uncultured archaeon]|nr:Uncharacterised protein [uncultured archaeon]
MTKSKLLFLSLSMLLGCAALLYALSSAAFAGQGCGTNWMGDTSGDTDFYVSKNQNLGTSDQSTAASSAKPALALGSTATKASQTATIQSLEPDKASSEPGSAITWTAIAAYSGNGQLLYDFLLKGPATGDQLKDETGWTAKNAWTWNITDADAGENLVEVRVMKAGSDGYDDSRTASYTVSVGPQNGQTASDSTISASSKVSNAAASDVSFSGDDSTPPAARTSDSMKDKPRIAPDEIKRTTPVTSGPNMQMPDPTPKPLVNVGTATTTSTTSEIQPTETSAPAEESKVMEVDGKWTVKLQITGSSMDLVLIQTGESVTGMGSLNDQNTKIPIIATGDVTTDSLSLDVKTVVGDYVNKIDRRFNLDLVKADRVISGRYEEYSGADYKGEGNATASRFAT